MVHMYNDMSSYMYIHWILKCLWLTQSNWVGINS